MVTAPLATISEARRLRVFVGVPGSVALGANVLDVAGYSVRGVDYVPAYLPRADFDAIVRERDGAGDRLLSV